MHKANMGTVTHERILRAVGRVLDVMGAQSYSIAETTHGGLRLDITAETGAVHTLDLSLADLSELIEWHPASGANVTVSSAPQALRRVLTIRQPELVGAR